MPRFRQLEMQCMDAPPTSVVARANPAHSAYQLRGDSVNVIKGGDRVHLPGVVLHAPSRNSFNGSAKGSARYTVNWRKCLESG